MVMATKVWEGMIKVRQLINHMVTVNTNMYINQRCKEYNTFYTQAKVLLQKFYSSTSKSV